jgi:subtilisin family serine protease
MFKTNKMTSQCTCGYSHPQMVYTRAPVIKKVEFVPECKIPSPMIKQIREILNLTGVDRWHSTGFTGNNVNVAIMDTGLDIHEYYKKSLGQGGITFERKGYHGTHVAGIVHSMAPGATLIDYQISIDDSFLNSLTSLAFNSILRSNIDVVNISSGADMFLGTPEGKYELGEKYVDINDIWEAFEKAGIMVVISAGNNSSSTDAIFKQMASTYSLSSTDFDYHYGSKICKPTRNKWPITVTSCRLDGIFSDFNSVSRGVQCMSFGDEIWSCVGTSEYITRSGTSMSTPQVSGILAVMLSFMKIRYPTMSKSLRATIVRKYLLNECTIRNVPDMIERLPVNTTFIKYYNMINRYEKLVSYSPSYRETVIRCINDFMKEIGIDIINNNFQFTTLGKQCIQISGDYETKLKAYRDLSYGIIRKFTTLSLGYGIVSLKSTLFIPNDTKFIIRKDPFEL